MADYPIRTSELGKLDVVSVASSSIVQIGDRSDLNASLRGLAVQREISHDEAGDVYFESYDIFNRPLPSLLDAIDNPNEALSLKTHNKDPRISVGCISVLAVSASASILIGSGKNTTAESRIKNIRQYRSPQPYPALPEETFTPEG